MSDPSPAPPRTAGRGRGQGRGRRGGGGGGGGDASHSDAQPREAGRGGGRRGGGNRGNRGAATGLGVDGNRIPASAGDPAAAARLKREKDGEKPGPEEDDVEAEVCFICASPVVHNSVAPCNHRTCHICALRMRALYKTKDCAHCRVCYPISLEVNG